MKRFKATFFSVSCLFEMVAMINFTAQGVYAVTAFIIAKWLFVLVIYGLERIICPNGPVK